MVGFTKKYGRGARFCNFPASAAGQTKSAHQPVLLREVLDYLGPQPNQHFIDCTLGEGGHAIPILKKTSPHGRVLGIDWNREVIGAVKLKIKNLKLKNRLILVNDNFARLKKIIDNYKFRFRPVHGILLDLGLSTFLLEKSGRGFSFLRKEPLDMRYSQIHQNLTAEEIVNTWPKTEIEEILKEYGEEIFARQIAKAIVTERKKERIKTTFQLVQVIKKAVPLWYQHRRLHCATKTFQALRIAVNEELKNLSEFLSQMLEVLTDRGRVVIISYHSLEDRKVKNYFREDAKKRHLRILTKKPIQATAEEIKNNPRSRSAKLRAAEKIKSFV